MKTSYFYKRWGKLLGLLLLLLLGVAGRSQAQLYYLTSDGSAGNTATNDALNSIDVGLNTPQVLAPSITGAPAGLALDIPGGRVFVADIAGSGTRLIKVTTLSGGLIRSFSVPTTITALEYASGYLYYVTSDGTASAGSNDALYRILADGTASAETLATGIANIPGALSLNLNGNEIYVSENSTSAGRGISVFTLSGSTATFNRKIATTTLQISALDYASNGYIYYLTSDGTVSTNNPDDALNRILASSGSGTAGSVLLASVGAQPNYLALDIANSRVFVFDANSASRSFKLITLSSNGSSATLTKSRAQTDVVTAIELQQAATPSVTTASPATSITATSATVGGTLTSDGGGALTSYGVVYIQGTGTPTLGSNTGRVVAGTSSPGAFPSNFSASLTGLTAGTTYTAAAYATNATGTVYGANVTFTTATAATTVSSIVPASASPTSASTVQFTVTFAASVTGLTSSNFTTAPGSGISGSSVTSVTPVSGTVYTVTVNTGSGSGTLGLTLANDTGLSPSISNDPFTGTPLYTIDKTPPAAPVVTAPADGSFVATTTPAYTGTAEANSTVTVIIDGSVLGTTTANNSGNWSLTQPTALTQGSHTVRATATDAAGNTSPSSTTNNFTVDTMRPDVTISSMGGNNNSTTNTTPIPFTVTFSESVTNFVAGDVVVGNGSITSGSFSGSGATYNFTVTPTTAGTATTVDVAANVAVDQANNGNTAATQFSITYQVPAVTVASVTRLALSPTATTSVSYRVVFSGSVSGLRFSNFAVTTTSGAISGASVTSVSGTGTTYTVTVNTGTGNGTLRLDVVNSTGISPSVTNVPYTTGEEYTITKTFAAAPILRIQAAGSASNNGDVTAFVDVVQVLQSGTSTAVANGLQNGSFETNNVPANSFKKTADGVVAAPWSFTGLAGVALTGSGFSPPTPPNGNAVALVQSAGNNDASISQNLAVPTGSYQINFQTAQRDYTARDQRLNVFVNDVFVGSIQPTSSTSYEPFISAAFNVAAPALTATVSTTSASPTSTAPIPFSVTFSQSVGSTFTASDVTVAGGAVTSGSFSGSGAGPYTFTVTPSGAGTVSVSLAASVANDANNTLNTASNSVSVQFQAPTITVGPSSLLNGQQGVAYSQPLSASGGTAPYSYAITAGALPAGLSLTNGTIAGTPTTNGTFSFTVTATDASAAPGPYSGSRNYSLFIAAPAVTSVSWNGSQSTNWFTATNWTPNQVPDLTIDAVIPTSPSGNRFPVIAANASLANARNVSIASGASLSMSDNTLTIAANLTNNGTFNGFVGSSATATGGTVALGGSALSLLNGSGVNRFWNLTVGASGAQLNNPNATSVQRLLTLNGNLAANGNPFTLLSNAIGTALVVNNGSSVVNGTATVQRAIDPSVNSGLGYRHYSAPVSNSTVGDLTTSGFTPVLNPAFNSSATPYSVVPFPTVYGYDDTRMSLTNNLSNFDKGFFSPGALSDALAVGRGYTVNIGASEVVDFVGSLNNGNVTVPLTSTRNTYPDGGWQLLGNPYPAPLDYRLVDPTDRSGLEATIYIYSSTSQYGGFYRSYVNSVGNSVLPVGQGFFARVAEGQATASLTFRNSQRLTAPNSTTFQRTAADPRPLVQLELRNAGSAVQDELYVYFEAGAGSGFEPAFDAEKLPNPSGFNLSTSLSATKRLAIDGQEPLGTTQRVLTLAVSVPAAGTYTLEASQLLNLSAVPVYLRDRQLGTLTDLRQQPTYQFVVANATALNTPRFELVFSPQQVLATVPAALAQQVGLYPNPARTQTTLVLPAALSRQPATAILLDALGRVVRQQPLPAGQGTHTLPLAELVAGVYSLRLTTDQGTVVKKLVIE